MMITEDFVKALLLAVKENIISKEEAKTYLTNAMNRNEEA